jgi:hypothetical protein
VRKKIDLSTLTIPDEKKRRGSFIVRQALRRVTLRQNKAALKAAAWMLLLMPVVQAILLVGLLNSELWHLLLCVEGGLIALLAASQLRRPTPENRAIGYGIALLNIAALSLLGVFLGVHVLWVTGVLTLIPVSWLVLAPTRARTVKLAWAVLLAPTLLLVLAAGAARAGFELSKTEEDPARQLTMLQAAWTAGNVRGMNNSERALLRLRMAQAAFADGDYQRAFDYADDGVFTKGRSLRPIPQSPIGEYLLDGLLMIKAQAYYNVRWDADRQVQLRLGTEPLDAETRSHEHIRARWAW